MTDFPHHQDEVRSSALAARNASHEGSLQVVIEQMKRRPGFSLLICGFGLFALSYFLVLLVVRPETGLKALLLGALNNALSALIVAGIVMTVLRRFVVDAPLGTQLLAHCVLAPAATLLWYLAVIVGIGLRNGSLTEGFSVSPFPAGALSWQIFQGFFLYGSVAAASYAIAFSNKASAAMAALRAKEAASQASEDSGGRKPRRLMIKDGSEIQHVEINDIIAVLARDEYVELVTQHRSYLSRQSLTSVLEALPESFIRVHRSRVINLDKVLSAEPAGDGRLAVHLEASQTVVTSRAGARALREQAR